MAAETQVDKLVARVQNRPRLAGIIAVGLAVIAVGSFTDAIGKIADFVARLGTSGEPQFAELIENVSQFVIEGRVERASFSGDLVITPVGLFRDPGTLADGSSSGYTFLLCRFTNTGDQPVTIGAVVDESDRWYRLDDPGFGYRPVSTSLAQWQMWFRGRPIDPEQLAEQKARFGSPVVAATLDPGRTKYGYVNSLGHPWPESLTLSVIDVTDTEAGKANLLIHLAKEGG